MKSLRIRHVESTGTARKRLRIQNRTMEIARGGTVRNGSKSEPAERNATIHYSQGIRHRGSIHRPLRGLGLMDSCHRHYRERIAGGFFRLAVVTKRRRRLWLYWFTTAAIGSALAGQVLLASRRAATGVTLLWQPRAATFRGFLLAASFAIRTSTRRWQCLHWNRDGSEPYQNPCGGVPGNPHRQQSFVSRANFADGRTPLLCYRQSPN